MKNYKHTDIKYIKPTLVKGKKPSNIPKGSSLEKEMVKNYWYVNYTFNGKQYRIKEGINRIHDYKEREIKAEELLNKIIDDLKNGFNPEKSNEYFNKKVNKKVNKKSELLPIAFGKWLFTNKCFDLIHDLKIVGEDTSIEGLFEEFKKEYYGNK